MIGASLVPGLPNIYLTPSARSVSIRAIFPDNRVKSGLLRVCKGKNGAILVRNQLEAGLEITQFPDIVQYGPVGRSAGATKIEGQKAVSVVCGQGVKTTCSDHLFAIYLKDIETIAAQPELVPEQSKSVLERIIVPLDGSARAEEVLNLVVPLAELLGSELTLLHVLLARRETPGQPGEINYPDTLHDRTRALATDYLSEVAKNYVQDRVRTKTVIASGRVSDMILAHAEHGSFSMIAVGARPRARILRFFRERITETIWARAAAPLLFWTPPADGEGTVAGHTLPKRIVIPVNGTSRADTALEYVGQVAAGAGMSVTLLGIKPARSLRLTQGLANGQNGIRYLDSPGDYLEERSEKLQAAGISADILNLDSQTAEALSWAEGNLPSHIVVMAGGRRRTLNRVFYGYAVTRLVRRISNPIIFLPPGYEPPDDAGESA